MRAARISGKDQVELVEAPVPEPAAEEVLIRVLRCGICGSDLHAYHGQWKAENYPLGHEFCGIVEAVGEDVESFSRGERVCAECFSHCGRCRYCLTGEYNQCEATRFMAGRAVGALAEKLALPAVSLFHVPGSLTDVQGMMVEPLAVAFHAVARAGIESGYSVAVIGAGTVGILAAAVAMSRGASHVFLVARHPHQAEAASRLGIESALLPRDGDPRKLIRDATDDRGVDVAIDAVAKGTSLSTALALVRKKGTTVVLGGITGPLMTALAPLVSGEVEMRGSSCYAMTEGKPDFQWARELIEAGTIDPTPLVTHTFPLEQVDEAFRVAADKGAASIKVAVTM